MISEFVFGIESLLSLVVIFSHATSVALKCCEFFSNFIIGNFNFVALYFCRKKLLLFGLLASTTFAKSFSSGKCSSNVKTVKNLDLNKLAGEWKKLQSYPTMNALEGYSISVDYGSRDSGSATKIFLRRRSENLLTTTAQVAASGILHLTVPHTKVYVIGTDYINYLVVYLCSINRGKSKTVGNRADNFWILSRKSNLDPVFLEKSFADLFRMELSTDVKERKLDTDDEEDKKDVTTFVKIMLKIYKFFSKLFQ